MLSRGDLRLVLSAPGGGPGGGQAMPDGRVPAAGRLEPLLARGRRSRRHRRDPAQAGAHFRNDIVTGVGGKQILLDDPSGQPDRAVRAVSARGQAVATLLRSRFAASWSAWRPASPARSTPLRRGAAQNYSASIGCTAGVAHCASARSPSGMPSGVGTSGVSRRYHSASSAASQPEPAAVIAWR